LGQSVSVFWPDRRPDYTQRWSINIQRELPSRTMVEVGYVGNRAVGLNMAQDFDAIPAQYLSTSQVRDQNTINYVTAAVPNPFFGLPQFAGTNLASEECRSTLKRPDGAAFSASAAVSAVCGRQHGEPDRSRFPQPGLSAGYSFYNALEVRAQKRFSTGLTIQASYAWSKFMQATSKLNPTDPHGYYVISTMDRPQRVVVSGIYELPVARGRHFLSQSPLPGLYRRRLDSRRDLPGSKRRAAELGKYHHYRQAERYRIVRFQANGAGVVQRGCRVQYGYRAAARRQYPHLPLRPFQRAGEESITGTWRYIRPSDCTRR
jgi:hypothetical protein